MISEFFYTATIANGASLSGGVNIQGLRIAGIIMPSSWTTANLTFQGSVDGTTFFDLYDESGTEITVTAAASRYIRLSLADWLGLRVIKVRSGTTGTPVNQGADRDITLVTVC